MAIFLLSCVEPFHIDLPPRSVQYLVEAKLFDDERFQYVKVFQINERGVHHAVTDCQILLENSTGAILQFVADETGNYTIPSYLPIETGELYRIRVQINENTTLVSEWETVPEKVEVAAGFWQQTSSLYYNANGIPITLYGFNYTVNTSELSDDHVFLRWEYETTHINEAPYSPPLCFCRNCYIRTIPKNFVNSIAIHNSKGKALLNHPLEFIRLDKRFSFRMTMLVRQISHSKNAGTFYDFIQQQHHIRGTVFDPPPAILKGNIYFENDTAKFAYGLFEVGRLDESTITIYQSDLAGNIVTYASECQVKLYSGVYDAACFYCFEEKGAGPRPYYFD